MGDLRIVLVDDHHLFRKGLKGIIESINDSFKVIDDFSNGQEFLNWYSAGHKVDVVVLDVNMPVLDGFQTSKALQEFDVKPKVLALTMLNDEMTLVRLIRSGVDGFLNKDAEPDQLESAILSLGKCKKYYTADTASMLVDHIQENSRVLSLDDALTERELEYIELACSDKPLKLIAQEMNISARTLENYQAAVYEKLGVKSRVGLAISALKNHLISIDSIN
jgi:DNA-binding NarL/FixJ family response regulator